MSDTKPAVRQAFFISTFVQLVVKGVSCFYFTFLGLLFWSQVWFTDFQPPEHVVSPPLQASWSVVGEHGYRLLGPSRP